MVVEQFKKLWLPSGVDFMTVPELSADHCSVVLYSLPPRTLFSPAINFFPPSRLLNSLAIHSITLALPPLLPKSLSPSTARLSSAPICYIHFNPHPLRLSIATLTLQISNI